MKKGTNPGRVDRPSLEFTREPNPSPAVPVNVHAMVTNMVPNNSTDINPAKSFTTARFDLVNQFGLGWHWMVLVGIGWSWLA